MAIIATVGRRVDDRSVFLGGTDISGRTRSFSNFLGLIVSGRLEATLREQLPI